MSIYRQESNESFIRHSTVIHKGKYDYSFVDYKNARTKVQIVCPLHGPFLQTPDCHKRGQGCPKCKGSRVRDIQGHPQERVIEDFKKIHGDIYDYSRVIYVNHTTKCEIVCHEHGSFWKSPAKHKQGQGCPTCGRKKGTEVASVTKKGNPSPKRLPFQTFVDRVNQIHGFRYDYSLSEVDYEHSNSRIEIICPDHGSFTQRASKHLKGRGCPHCHKSRQYSSMSQTWLDSLSLDLIREFRLPEQKIRSVDAYDPSTNTVYQFHGDYWHGNPRKFRPNQINEVCGVPFGDLYQKTLIADQTIRDLGYNLVVMWEMDWKNKQVSNRSTVRDYLVSKTIGD